MEQILFVSPRSEGAGGADDGGGGGEVGAAR